MKKIDWSKWSAIAEIASAVAIVVTLSYLALQTFYLAEQTEQSVVQTQQNNELLMQAELIATAQNGLLGASNRIDMLNAIADHADVWVRGNSGDELSEAQQATYRALIRSYNSVFFWSYYQDYLILGASAEESIGLTSFAYFLAQNPGAYAAWEEWEQGQTFARQALLPDDVVVSAGDSYQQVIRSYVQELLQGVDGQ